MCAQNETIQRPLLHAQAHAHAELKESAQKSVWPVPRPRNRQACKYNGVAKLNGGFADSAFADNKQRPIIVGPMDSPGFASEFVRDAFSRYLPAGATERSLVLDPFCGVGTTLIEACGCGHDAIGLKSIPTPR